MNKTDLLNKCKNVIRHLNRTFHDGNSYKSSFGLGYMAQPSEDIIESPDLWNAYNWRWFRYAHEDAPLDIEINLRTPFMNEKGKFLIYFGQEFGKDYDEFSVGLGFISQNDLFLYQNDLTLLRGQQLWLKLIEKGYTRSNGATDYRPCLGFCWFTKIGGDKILSTCSDASVFKSYSCVNLNKKYLY